MKSLLEVINEGNITNTERQYREFCEVVRAHNHTCENIYVKQTSKKNWVVYDSATDKRICLVSRYILSQDTAEKYNLIKAEEE